MFSIFLTHDTFWHPHKLSTNDDGKETEWKNQIELKSRLLGNQETIWNKNNLFGMDVNFGIDTATMAGDGV